MIIGNAILRLEPLIERANVKRLRKLLAIKVKFRKEQLMNSALDDLIIVIEWLSATKTPTAEVDAALKRLKKRSTGQIPVDVLLPPEKEDE